jgi:hypothetical protein
VDLALLAPAAGSAEAFRQQPLQSIQGSVRQNGGDDPPLRCSCRGGEQDVLRQLTCFQPLPQHFFIHEEVIHQPTVADAIKAGLDVAFKDPIGTA